MTDAKTALIKMWRGKFDFHGVSSRSEYWWPHLVVVLGFLIIISPAIILPAVGMPKLLSDNIAVGAIVIVALFLLLLSLPLSIAIIALHVRRMHDFGFSGWWLLPIASFGAVNHFIPMLLATIGYVGVGFLATKISGNPYRASYCAPSVHSTSSTSAENLPKQMNDLERSVIRKSTVAGLSEAMTSPAEPGSEMIPRKPAQPSMSMESSLLFYEAIGQELKDGRQALGLWTHAGAEAMGDQHKQAAIYTKLRFAQLSREAWNAQLASSQAEQNAIAAKLAETPKVLAERELRLATEAGSLNHGLWTRTLASANGDVVQAWSQYRDIMER